MYLELQYPSDPALLGAQISVPAFPSLLSCFLYNQINAGSPHKSFQVSPSLWPVFNGPISVFNSTTILFHSPSESTKSFNVSQEVVHVCPNWQKKMPWYDCIAVAVVANLLGLCSM